MRWSRRLPGERRQVRLARLAFTAAAFSVFGCGKSKPPVLVKTTQAAGPVANAVIDPSTAGAISGVVRFRGSAPRSIQIDMAEDPACATAAAEHPNLTQQYAISNGRVANVFIYVKSGLGDRIYAPPKTAVVLDQQACRFVPHVIAAMVGQPVEFRNSDPTMHNVHIVPPGSDDATGIDISQPPMAGTERRSFPVAGVMIPVRCNNHPWMQAFLNVAENPFFAVSDRDGRFTISGLPPGSYTLEAVQEKLGSRTAQVTVKSRQTAKIDFTFGR